MREVARQLTDEGLEIEAELELLGPLVSVTVRLPGGSELLEVSAPYQLAGDRVTVSVALEPFEEGRVSFRYRIIQLNDASFEALWQAVDEGLALVALPCEGRVRCGFFRGRLDALKARWEGVMVAEGDWVEVDRATQVRRLRLGLSRLELRLRQQWLPELGDGVALALIWLGED